MLAVDLPAGTVLDATTPGLLFGMTVGRFACFFGGCCAGRPSGGGRWWPLSDGGKDEAVDTHSSRQPRRPPVAVLDLVVELCAHRADRAGQERAEERVRVTGRDVRPEPLCDEGGRDADGHKRGPRTEVGPWGEDAHHRSERRLRPTTGRVRWSVYGLLF